MAERKKAKAKKKETLNLPVLLTILAVCVVIVVIIAVALGNVDGSDDTDDSGKSTDSAQSDVGDTSKLPMNSDSSEKNDSQSSTDTTDDEDDTADDTVTETESDEKGNNTPPSVTVGAEKENKSNGSGDISMIYPTVILDGKDTVDEGKLNQLIREYMDEKIKADGLSSSGDSYTYKITDIIPMLITEKFVSVVVEGEYYFTDSPNPTVFSYAVNCDLKSGELLMPSDLVSDFSSIKTLFIEGKFSLAYGVDGLMNETNYEDMIIEYRPEYGRYPNVYFTEKGFGMIIELVYTLGGYARFEIPYSYVKGDVYCPID